MINRRLQNFYHKQKKWLFVVFLVLLITCFQLRQISSTNIAFGASLKSTIVPISVIPPSLTPFQSTPGPSPAVTIYPQPTNIVPPSPALSWVPGPSVTSFPISPIMVSLTPTYTPTVTPTSTPYPTIAIFHFPTITTTSLPRGKLFKTYLAYVEGYDIDPTLNLTMHITNLPRGLYQDLCAIRMDNLNRKNIRCTIAGKPAQMGLYNVNIDLYNGQGGMVGKLTLKIGLR